VLAGLGSRRGTPGAAHERGVELVDISGGMVECARKIRPSRLARG
jgi:hypothetical protein